MKFDKKIKTTHTKSTETTEKKAPDLPIQMLDPSTLIPYDRNAKVHSPEQVSKLKASITEYGFDQPIVVDKNMVIIKGHGRHLASMSLELDKVPVIVRDDLNPQQVKASRLADNKVSSTEYDEELVQLEVEELLGFDDSELNAALLGYDEKEFQKLTDTIATDQEKRTKTDADGQSLSEKDGDDFNPEMTDEPAITQYGDVYQLGSHRLMCGDSTKAHHLAILMNGEKADMVFTDPPYGVDYKGGHNEKKRDGIDGDKLEGADLTDLFFLSLSNAIDFSQDYSAFYVWYADRKSVETYAAFSKLPLVMRSVITWYKVKSGLGSFMSQYIPNHEPCIYAHKVDKSPRWNGPTNEKTVWELPKDSRNDFHPTQKPVGLSCRAIANSSNHNDIVLDVFGGSGATLIGAEKEARRCYMMELDPKYCDVIVKRWEEFTGKEALLVRSGEENPDDEE